jgi:ABC-type phosphate transport system permease subunit
MKGGTIMKTDNIVKYRVITYLLLFLCAVCISFHLTINGVQSVQEIQDSQLISENNEYNNSGDGNNNSIINKIISTILNSINANNKSGLLFFLTGAFGIILFIQINESYIYEHDYFSRIYTRSLIAQKIRLNN